MARFMKKNIINPKSKQSETAKELDYSSSTLKPYKNDIKMLSTHKIQSNTNRRKQIISSTKHEPKRSQISSNHPVVISETETNEPIKPGKSKKKRKVLEI